jgi:hypothetical protein
MAEMSQQVIEIIGGSRRAEMSIDIPYLFSAAACGRGEDDFEKGLASTPASFLPQTVISRRVQGGSL